MDVNVFFHDPAMVVAEKRRLFAAEGLEVVVTETPDSTAMMLGLSEGRYQAACGAFDNVLAWSGRAGAELVAVAQLSRSILLTLIARPEIHDWEDLRGKPLAADAVDTAFALVLRRLLLAHGLDFAAGDYQLLPIGATQPRLDSLRRGETVAAMLNPPVDRAAMAEGMVRLGDHREVLPDYPGTIMAVERGWGEMHADAVVGFLRAWLAGGRWIKEHHDEALDLIAEANDTTREGAAGLLRSDLGDGRPSVPGLQSVLDLRAQLGLAPPLGLDLSRYYDASYAERAHAA